MTLPRPRGQITGKDAPASSLKDRIYKINKKKSNFVHPAAIVIEGGRLSEIKSTLGEKSISTLFGALAFSCRHGLPVEVSQGDL